MGSLTPGATYVYERIDGRIYAREVGSTKRRLLGYDAKDEFNKYFTLWNDVLLESEHNPALHRALEKAITLYRLSKDNPL